LGFPGKVGGKLLRDGLIEEVPAGGSLPVWRRDDDAGPLALRISERGLVSIGVEGGTPQEAGAALPLRLGARTMAPSSRREAADSSTSWVSVSFIGSSVRFATASRAVTTEARTGWKAGGAGPGTADWCLAGRGQ